MAVDKSVEDSIKRGNAKKTEVRIYTNRSGINRMARAVVVIYSGNKPPKVLIYCLGPLTEHTMFEVQVVGIMLAMHILKFEKHIKTTTISLNNQAVIAVNSQESACVCREVL
jgi:hypothetical protein